jgi:hypothetical protein
MKTGKLQTNAARLTILLGLAAAGLFGADNSVGVWKRNVEQTKYATPDPNPITGIIMVREAVPGGLKVTSKGQRKDGTVIDYTFTVIYDGKDYPVSGTGSVFDTIAITQIDANTFPSVTKKGLYHMKGLTEISKDGKTMTISNEGTDAQGKPQTFKVVWNKQ